MGFIEKMLKSAGSDWYIFAAALLALVCLVIVRNENRSVEEEFETWKSENHYSRYKYKRLTNFYSLFLTLITIFPLLGMLGTVIALLQLDFTGDAALALAKSSFFDALTSTAWGIIFALIFKLANAFIATSVTDNIEKVSALIDGKAENIDGKQEKEKEKAKKRKGRA